MWVAQMEAYVCSFTRMNQEVGMSRILAFVIVALSLAGCDEGITQGSLAPDEASFAQAATGPGGAAVYEVTVRNLTEGQPFTPPLAVVHRQSVELFRPGSPASFQLKEIAENGNLAPMLEVLDGHRHVADFVVSAGDPPPLLPGQARSFYVNAAQGARYLSLVSMLICTNDGFTGVNSGRLPRDVGESTTSVGAGYDAGTETNTEAWEDLVPPCAGLTGFDNGGAGTGMSNPALAEGGVVHHHGGITGAADLSVDPHDWTNPVIEIIVTRVG
jgi:hypothetical protein